MTNKLLTVKGLEYLTYASLMAIGWSLMSLVGLLFYFFVTTYHYTPISEIIGWGTISIRIILYGLGGVLFIVGLYWMWKGRDEFGKNHVSNVDKSLWLIIIILAISALISGPFTMVEPYSILITTIPYFLLTLMILITPLYLLKSLSPLWIKNMLIVGASIFVILYLIATTIQYGLDVVEWFVPMRTVSIFSDLIPYTLVFIAFYKTLIHVRDKGVKTT